MSFEASKYHIYSVLKKCNVYAHKNCVYALKILRKSLMFMPEKNVHCAIYTPGIPFKKLCGASHSSCFFLDKLGTTDGVVSTSFKETSGG